MMTGELGSEHENLMLYFSTIKVIGRVEKCGSVRFVACCMPSHLETADLPIAPPDHIVTKLLPGLPHQNFAAQANTIK